MKKRLLGILLCIALVAGILPAGLFSVPASADGKLYKTENVQVPAGWDYIEVKNANELKEALNKHVWNEKKPQSVFIRLVDDIKLTDAGLSKTANSLINACITNSTTVDFNGHTIKGNIYSKANPDNKTWSVLNLLICYGCYHDLTLRFVDSVGGGGVRLKAETYVDGPTNAVCIHADNIQKWNSSIKDKDACYKSEGVKVIFDGGSYYLDTSNTHWTNTQLDMFHFYADQFGQACWDYNTPFTRSAVGVENCKCTVNNGHFTAVSSCIEGEDNKTTTELGNRYVSALGLADSYAVDNLRINGGDFDGTAFAVYHYNKYGQSRSVPCLNGGSYKGGIMVCSLKRTYWGKIYDGWELDNESKNWSAGVLLKNGAKMYVDGKPADLQKVDLEEIGLPHEVVINSAPEITAFEPAETTVLVNGKAYAAVQFNKKPDSLVAEEFFTSIRNGKEESYYRTLEGAKCSLDSEDDILYNIELPAQKTETTVTVRIHAKYGDFDVYSEPVSYEWVTKPDFRFTLQPASKTTLADNSVGIPFDYNFHDMLSGYELYWLDDTNQWSKASNRFFTDENGLTMLYIKGPEVEKKEKITYSLILKYNTKEKLPVEVYSQDFTVTWDYRTVINELELPGNLLTGVKLSASVSDASSAVITDSLWYRNNDIVSGNDIASTGLYYGLLKLQAKDKYVFTQNSWATIFGCRSDAVSVSPDGKTAFFYTPTVALSCDHSGNTNKIENDSNTHWYVCSVCGLKLNPEKHRYGEGVTAGGITTYTCKDCKYQKTKENGKERIDWLKLDVQTLAVGSALPEVNLAEYYDGGAELISYQWYDGTNKVNAGTVIEKGKTYSLIVTCNAKDGFFFHNEVGFLADGKNTDPYTVSVTADGASVAAEKIKFNAVETASAEIHLPAVKIGKTVGELLNEIEKTVIDGKTDLIGELDAEITVDGVSHTFWRNNYTDTWKLPSEDTSNIENLKKETIQPNKNYRVNVKILINAASRYIRNEDVAVLNEECADSVSVSANSKNFTEVIALYSTGGNGKNIGFVNLGVTAPAVGETPQNSATGNGNYKIDSVNWSGSLSSGGFACNTKYTVTVTVSPAGGSVFADNAFATVNGNPATVTKDGAKRKISFTFEALPHSFTSWKYDDAQHWKACSAPGCTEKQNKAAHTMKNGICTVCGYIAMGDVDGNGVIDVKDARYALRAAIKLTDSGLDFTKKTNREFIAADTDGNGELNVKDARNILRAAIKLDKPSDWKQ